MIFSKLPKLKSLKVKLLIFNTITILLVIIISTMYMIHESTDNAIQDMKNSLKNQSTTANIILNNEINKLSEINNSIAKTDSLKTLIQFNMKEQLENTFLEYEKKYTKIDEMIVYDGKNELYKSSDKYSKLIKEKYNSKKSLTGIISNSTLQIFSLENIFDANNKHIGAILISHDITNSFNLIKNISKSINTNTMLYKKNNLIAMSNSKGKIFKNNSKKNITLNVDIKESKGTFLGEAKNLFNQNYFMYCIALKDFKGNNVGTLAVGNSDVRLKEITNNIFTNMIAIGIILLLIGFVLTWIIATIITNPIKLLLLKINLLQKGNLTVTTEYSGNDELKELSLGFNKMVSDLKCIVEMIIKRSNTISEINKDLFTKFKNLVDSMKNINTQMSTIDFSSTDNTSVVKEVNLEMQIVATGASNIVITTSKNSEKSNTTVIKTIDTQSKLSIAKKSSNSILDEYNALKHIMDGMDNIAIRSDGVVSLINGIANTTKLLSLNASIEAAKAGIHGKSFNIVATEIRKLSERIKEQTGVVTGFNRELMNYVGKLKMKLADNSIAISTNLEAINDLENEFLNLIDFIKESDTSMKEVVGSATNQACSVQEISSSLEQISINSVKTSDSVSNITSILNNEYNSFENSFEKLENLNNEFSKLKVLVSQFKVN
ncbi:MAG: methyl-accepting chemotaxis protein [Clostridiales bacterium]